MKTIGLLVTGHGEVDAVPVLIRRLFHEVLYVFDVQPGNPVIRQPESKILKVGDDTLERKVQQLASRHDAVLVLIDLEDDCPAQYGPQLQGRMTTACPHKPCTVVCAYREFETWFVYDSQNLFGVQPPNAPERKRNSKKWLKGEGRIPNYNEVADSPGLCGRLNLLTVRAGSDSFRVFTDRVRDLAVKISSTTVSPYP